ncbi:CreA family protein, partial [Rhizobium ruizarguesonis]
MNNNNAIKQSGAYLEIVSFHLGDQEFCIDIIVEAVSDPEVKGITCHVTYFDRSLIDRFKNGNWFEDPSNNSIACRQTGP